MGKVAILSPHSSSLKTTSSVDNMIPHTPIKLSLKSPNLTVAKRSPYRIPARRTLHKENVKPIVDYLELSRVLVSCSRKVKENIKKKKGCAKDSDLSLPKMESREVPEWFAGFVFFDSPSPSALPIPRFLDKKVMA
ncbi:hypothetical protein CTI12_AA362410 [Artemisia annua]|uniref:Uncharacterized protein n=1 Tax=Artemisia annua TaxID=35608 RepID=A0A2U1MMX0_ARTAN|nr:hypothetical protein CTI12_AA362410 [Artemisia annua]